MPFSESLTNFRYLYAITGLKVNTYYLRLIGRLFFIFIVSEVN